MNIEERQDRILSTVVSDYIRLAQPISSQWLEEKYDFGVSPATIRGDMQSLSEEGFLFQPYTSAGRVPTDLGYRRFVDGISSTRKNTQYDIDAEDEVEFLQGFLEQLSDTSPNLVAFYYRGRLWKEGWDQALQSPEFEEPKMLARFLKFIEDVGEGIEDLPFEKEVEIYIGKENPFSRMHDFSFLAAPIEHNSGVVAIMGPKRMPYATNLHILHSLLDI